MQSWYQYRISWHKSNDAFDLQNQKIGTAEL